MLVNCCIRNAVAKPAGPPPMIIAYSSEYEQKRQSIEARSALADLVGLGHCRRVLSSRKCISLKVFDSRLNGFFGAFFISCSSCRALYRETAYIVRGLYYPMRLAVQAPGGIALGVGTQSGG
jgi:hypothetical protein